MVFFCGSFKTSCKLFDYYDGGTASFANFYIITGYRTFCMGSPLRLVSGRNDCSFPMHVGILILQIVYGKISAYSAKFEVFFFIKRIEFSIKCMCYA